MEISNESVAIFSEHFEIKPELLSKLYIFSTDSNSCRYSVYVLLTTGVFCKGHIVLLGCVYVYLLLSQFAENAKYSVQKARKSQILKTSI